MPASPRRYDVTANMFATVWMMMCGFLEAEIPHLQHRQSFFSL